MHIESIRRAGQGLGRHAMLGAASAVLLLAGPAAQAQVKEAISIENYLEHSFLPTGTMERSNDARVSLHRSPGTDLAPQYGVDFTGTADEQTGGFYFLHNLYCVSLCAAAVRTVVTITVTNEGSTPVSRRLISEITPGHLVRNGINSTASASFDFQVTQSTNGGASKTLYSAVGKVNYQANQIKTSDGKPFNHLKHIKNGTTADIQDWSASNLDLLLDPIPAGGTAIVTYSAVTTATTTDSRCGFRLANCPGIQIAFGDPRNGGDGGPEFSSGALPMLIDFKVPRKGPKQAPVIGRRFAPYWVKVQIVPVDAPAPAEPEKMPDVIYLYNAPFKRPAEPPKPSDLRHGNAGWIT